MAPGNVDSRVELKFPGSVGPGAEAPQGGDHETSPRHLTFCVAAPVVRTSQDQRADAARRLRRPVGRFCLFRPRWTVAAQTAADGNLEPKATQLRVGVLRGRISGLAARVGARTQKGGSSSEAAGGLRSCRA